MQTIHGTKVMNYSSPNEHQNVQTKEIMSSPTTVFKKRPTSMFHLTDFLRISKNIQMCNIIHVSYSEVPEEIKSQGNKF